MWKEFPLAAAQAAGNAIICNTIPRAEMLFLHISLGIDNMDII